MVGIRLNRDMDAFHLNPLTNRLTSPHSYRARDVKDSFQYHPQVSEPLPRTRSRASDSEKDRTCIHAGIASSLNVLELTDERT